MSSSSSGTNSVEVYENPATICKKKKTLVLVDSDAQPSLEIIIPEGQLSIET